MNCPILTEQWNILAGTAHWADVPHVTRCALGIAPPMRLSNQKNGVHDTILTHKPVNGKFCPVKATARRYAASRQTSPTNAFAILCQYAPNKILTAKHIAQVLQQAAFIPNNHLDGRI